MGIPTVPVIIADYVGARPGDHPPPDISGVPVAEDPYSLFAFTLAFANDAGGGNFQPEWDSSITPGVISQLTQSNTSIAFAASLGGDAMYNPWAPPSDQASWVSNATSSLLQVIYTYGLGSLNIDYEGDSGGNPLDDSFVECMSQVIDNIGSELGAPLFTISPFNATVPQYQSLYQQCSQWINSINYQAYADAIADEPGYLNLYAKLTQTFDCGYDKLGLGIASSTSAPRGLQPPEIYSVWNALHAQGVKTAAIWCLEDSLLCDPPYVIEATIQSGA